MFVIVVQMIARVIAPAAETVTAPG
jgi:hypothetical protein